MSKNNIEPLKTFKFDLSVDVEELKKSLNRLEKELDKNDEKILGIENEIKNIDNNAKLNRLEKKLEKLEQVSEQIDNQIDDIKDLIEENGKRIVSIKFSAYAMYILDNEFEGFQKVLQEAREKAFVAGAKLIYAGAKAENEYISFDYALRISSKLSIDNILDLFEFASETIEVNDRKKQRVVPQDHKKKK